MVARQGVRQGGVGARRGDQLVVLVVIVSTAAIPGIARNRIQKKMLLSELNGNVLMS